MRKRLDSLYRHLTEEGWHVHANTVSLVIESLGEDGELTEKASSNEVKNFLYKHGDLTYTAVSEVVNLLSGNGFGFTKGK